MSFGKLLGFVFVWMLTVSVAHAQRNPLPPVVDCYLTDSVTCEYVYADRGFPGIDACGGCIGPANIDCSTALQEVYNIPEGGYVQPYAKKTSQGKTSYYGLGFGQEVKCGTRRTCHQLCGFDSAGQRECKLTTFENDWMVTKSEATGNSCP